MTVHLYDTLKEFERPVKGKTPPAEPHVELRLKGQDESTAVKELKIDHTDFAQGAVSFKGFELPQKGFSLHLAVSKAGASICSQWAAGFSYTGERGKLIDGAYLKPHCDHLIRCGPGRTQHCCSCRRKPQPGNQTTTGASVAKAQAARAVDDLGTTQHCCNW